MMTIVKRYFEEQKLMFCLIIITVFAIFTQSVFSRETSAGESEALAGFLSAFLSHFGAFGRFLLLHLRKVAHFTEYALLGFEVALRFTVVRHRHRDDANSTESAPLSSALPPFFFRTLIFGWGVAFFDETIQIFSGRGPAIADVWLDVAGYLTGTLLTLLIAAAFLLFIRRKSVIGK